MLYIQSSYECNVIYLLSFTEPCTVDRELMDAHNVVFMYKDDDKLYSAHGDHITFMCSRGRRHDGKQGMRQQCIDGVMNLPTCR